MLPCNFHRNCTKWCKCWFIKHLLVSSSSLATQTAVGDSHRRRAGQGSLDISNDVFSTQLVMIPWINKLFSFSAHERHEYMMQSKKIEFTICIEVMPSFQFPWTINLQRLSTKHIQCKLKCNSCRHLFECLQFPVGNAVFMVMIQN